MIVKEITYVEPLSGEELTEKFYFHINSAEALRIMGRSGNKDWETYVKDVAASGTLSSNLFLLPLGIRMLMDALLRRKIFAMNS